MKKKENDFDLRKNSWNKYKQIHEEKINYYRRIYNYFYKIYNLLCEFETQYKKIDIESIVNPIEKDDKINEVIKLINKYFISFILSNKIMTQHILDFFKSTVKLIKNEKDIYDKVILSSMQYEEEKEKMNKCQKSFNEKMLIIEDYVKKEVLLNISKNIKEDIKLEKNKIEDANKEFTIYKKSVDEANKKRSIFNKKQNELLSIYQQIIIDKEADLYKQIISNFYMVQKNEQDLTSTNMEKTKDKKKVNKNEYTNNIMLLYKSDCQPDKEIEISSYHLNTKPYPTSKNSTSDDITRANRISDEIIRIMRKNFMDYYSDSELQIQESSIELPDVINNFLNIKNELTSEVKNEIIKLIRDDITIYPQIIAMLSRLRASSKLFKAKDHIVFLEKIFEEILVIAEEKKDYNAAKNCLLLSQTYYFKDEESDKKTFIFNKIKENKWIKTTEFWRVFINKQLLMEFNRYESLFPNQKVDLSNNDTNLSKKNKAKIKEIMFTSLISHISNMVDLNLDKRIILKILDEYINKYQYLDEITIQELYNLISSDKEEIEKLRKEYQNNINLENEVNK